MKATLRKRRRATGFTLIEMVIGAALMTLILTSAYLCLSACLSSQKDIEPRLAVVQNARVALAIMTADLRDACPLSKDFAFLGMQRQIGDIEADNLDFATHHYTPRRPREGDFCEVSYFVDKDPESGQLCLYRRRNPRIALNPLAGGSRELIAQGVRGLQFEYCDGLDWYDSWGEQNPLKELYSQRQHPNLEGMPLAVRITLSLDPNPPTTDKSSESEAKTEAPLVFQTIAYLTLAVNEQNTAAGSESTSANSATSSRGSSPGAGASAGGPGNGGNE